MSKVYGLARDFMNRFPGTIAWRIKKHCEVIEKNLNPDEEVFYAFAGQENDSPFDIMRSCVVALTNKRILIGQKRVLFGYFYHAITPDLFNDFKSAEGIIWGKVIIDTVKEVVTISNLAKKALLEIETMITEYMIKEKQRLYTNIGDVKRIREGNS